MGTNTPLPNPFLDEIKQQTQVLSQTILQSKKRKHQEEQKQTTQKIDDIRETIDNFQEN
jgi:hypothetical protein